MKDYNWGKVIYYTIENKDAIDEAAIEQDRSRSDFAEKFPAVVQMYEVLQNLKMRDHRKLMNLAKAEENRKSLQLLEEKKLPPLSYAKLLRRRYGVGKWAEKLIDEMILKHSWQT